MGAIASQIISLTIVYSIVYSDTDQRKHQSSASLAFVRGIPGGPVNSQHKWPVTRKMFPFDDVIMWSKHNQCLSQWKKTLPALNGCELPCCSYKTGSNLTMFAMVSSVNQGTLLGEYGYSTNPQWQYIKRTNSWHTHTNMYSKQSASTYFLQVWVNPFIRTQRIFYRNTTP